MLPGDRRGLEGLPLKLLLTSLILSLACPALYGSFNYLEFVSGANLGIDQAERVRGAALSAFIGGVGNVRRVSVSLDDITGARFAIRLGGEAGDPVTALIEVLRDGNKLAAIPLEDPDFRIITKDGSPLLIEGNRQLILTCLEASKGPVIVAEVI